MSSNIAIGIDLGTTFSCVAVYENKKVTVITSPEGSRITPSEVAFTDSEQLVGQSAKNQGAVNPKNTIFDVKRLIGRRYNDPSLKKDLENFPFCVVSKDSEPVIEVDFKKIREEFTPEQISGIILEKMKKIAERHLGQKVTNAVITVPAYFNQGQRQATKNAAKIAGLNVLRLINEPTAAALAFGFEKNISKKQTVLVFDLGGGTFDISIVTISPGNKFEVNATAGDTHFGGSDFDQILLEHFSKEFEKQHGVVLTKKPRSVRRLRTACESAKRSLSEKMKEMIIVDSLFDGIDLQSKITRTKFEDLCADLFKKVLEPVKQALSEAKLDKSKIDEILLVGGSTRIPKIQKILENFFNKKVLNNSINPDEAVAYGAAVQASFLLEPMGSSSENLDTSSEKLILEEKTARSIGSKTGVDGFMNKVIEKNTPIPTTKRVCATTVHDNQTTTNIAIYEGERPRAIDNHKLGAFELTDLPPLPYGKAVIEITFAIDSDGILTVTAIETSSEVKNSITITKQRFDDSDMNQMIEDTEKNKENDERFLKKVEARKNLDIYITKLRDFIEDNKESMSTIERELFDKSHKLGYVVWLDEDATETVLCLVYERIKQGCDPEMIKIMMKKMLLS